MSIPDSDPSVPPLVKDPNRILDQLNSFLEQAEYARAVELARAGSYLEAESIAIRLVEKKPSVLFLDLLARIYAQRGQFDDAKIMWERALQLDPTNQACQTGLLQIERRQKLSTHNWFSSNWLTIFLIAIVLLIFWSVTRDVNLYRMKTDELIAALLNTAPAPTPTFQVPTYTPEAEPLPTAWLFATTAAQNTEILAAIQSNQEQIRDLAVDVQNLREIYATTTPPHQTLQTALEIPGVLAEENANSLEIHFEDGLFLYDGVLTPDGKTTLQILGFQLEPYVGSISIEVIGFRNDLEADKEYLPLTRAQAVVKYLSKATQLPIDCFLIASPGDKPAPYPNDSRENRTRNQTVIIRIFPLK